MAFFVLYAVTVEALAVTLSFHGLDAETSISGALTALANVDPGIGGVIGTAGNFPSPPDGANVPLAFGMYADRLEMMTVYVLLLPAFRRQVS